MIHTGKPSEDTSKKNKKTQLGNVATRAGANGSHLIQLLHRGTGKWFEVADLRVTEILTEQVALAETYMLVYERADVNIDGSSGETAVERLARAPKVEVEEEMIDLEAMGIQIA